MEAQTIVFKEWLPDQPVFPGDWLIEATNVIPDAGSYRPFRSMATMSAGVGTLPAQPAGMIEANRSGSYVYAGTVDRIYSTDSGHTFSARTSTLSSFGDIWEFAQFDDLMIAVKGTIPFSHTIGSASNFATLAAAGNTAPIALTIGIVNRFVMVDQFVSAATVQWSGIDDATKWPTPNSATAIAQQSGEQNLDSKNGLIYKIIGGDQFGLIFQQRGITRVTYVGPPVVFQFDAIDTTHGLFCRTAAVKVGGITYFLANDGFFATDGVNLRPLGGGKVDRYFLSQIGSGFSVRASYDDYSKCVMWAYSDSTTSSSNNVACFNIDSGQWSRLDLAGMGGASSRITAMSPFSESLYTPFGLDALPTRIGPAVLDSNFVLSYFNGTPGTAVLTTCDSEVMPGGRGYIGGVKPHVNYTGSAPTIGVRVGTRDDLGTASSFSATTGATARTGFADFRKDGKYARAEVRISGNFVSTSGIEVIAVSSGKA